MLAATINYGLAVRFAEGWTVQMDAVLEPVVDPVGDEAFEGEDAFIETLSLQYAGEGFTVYAGKIIPCSAARRTSRRAFTVSKRAKPTRSPKRLAWAATSP